MDTPRQQDRLAGGRSAEDAADAADRWTAPDGTNRAVLRTGGRLGRYELIAPVGSGGMAQVWAARLEAYGGISKIVAIKTVLPHLAENADLQQMLLDEARIAARLHHPNVCTLLDAGEDRGIVFVALEWVDGDSLLHVLRAGRAARGASLGPLLAARVVADACAGLHAAHDLVDGEGRSLDVVHRDISPHNILLSIDGHVKVTDFGVAKSHGQWHQTTRSGEIRGKIAYMAPEQINAAPLDRRSDLFGMGCVLYEASTGRAPFRGDNDAALIRAVLDGRYEPPGQLLPGYPPGLAAIVEHALAPHPDARFATAAQMRAALEGWLAQLGTPMTSLEVGVLVRERLGAPLAVRRREIHGSTERESRGPSTRPVRVVPARTSVAIVPAPASLEVADAFPTGTTQITTPARGYVANLRLAAAIAAGLVAAGVIIAARLAGTVARPAENPAPPPLAGIVVRPSDRAASPPPTLPSLTIARRTSAADVSSAAGTELSSAPWQPATRGNAMASPPRPDLLAPPATRPAEAPPRSTPPPPPSLARPLPANPY
jgi:eukaryotic-like serine/threonine-protein kinase